MIQTIKQWLRKPDLGPTIKETNTALNREVVSYAARALKAEKDANEFRRDKPALFYKLQEAHIRLSRIAELETPRCAHVGRKMARIARGEG